MKIPILKYLQFSLLLVLAACNIPDNKPDGAYENISPPTGSSALINDSLRTITIFKNGYWVTISFTKHSLIKCYGGTYQRRNGNYIKKINFNSTETSLVGREYIYKYYSDDKYLITDFNNSDSTKKNSGKVVYKKIDVSEYLKDASLEGVWLMKPGQGRYNSNNRESIRIFAYPCFTRVNFNYKEKTFIEAYCGIYKFDGKSLIETVQYPFSDIAAGSTMEWEVKKLTDNEIQLFDIDSFFDEEIYEHSNNQ